ncbi:hypothetical protein Bca52824_084413, partial [Brassica carinata]
LAKHQGPGIDSARHQNQAQDYEQCDEAQDERKAHAARYHYVRASSSPTPYDDLTHATERIERDRLRPLPRRQIYSLTTRQLL